jgi:hypothetical protein
MQCTAHNRRGVQCERPALEGSVVCRLHGGGVPVAKAAARKRLLALVPDALEALQEAIDKADWSQVVRASLGILDRAGLGPHQTIAVEAEGESLKKLTDDELKARALQVLAVIEARKARALTPVMNDDEGTSETSSSDPVVH